MDEQIRGIIKSTGKVRKKLEVLEGRTNQRTKNDGDDQERRNWPKEIQAQGVK